MVDPLLIYTASRRPEIYSLRAAAVLLLAVAPTQKAARRSSRCEVDGLRFSVYALLLADHRLRLLGSPWFDPDAKPRSCFMLVCLFASPGAAEGHSAACDSA